MTSAVSRKEILPLASLACVGLVVLPCLNAFVPAHSPFHITTFTLSVYGKYLCYAVLALGVNLLWGYTGLFCRWLTSTKFGLIQRAIRDSENRVLFSGYSTAHFKLFVFVVAAVIAGLGGALYVPQAGIINPSEMAPDKSLEAVVWCAVGGRGSLLGPILGAVGCNWLKSQATHAFAEQWPYILGALFIFVTLFMPAGIVGLPEQFQALRRRLTGRANDDATGPPEGVTQVFYRERQLGRPNEVIAESPAAEPEATPSEK